MLKVAAKPIKISSNNGLLKTFFVIATLSMLLISDKEFIFAISIPQYPALNTILPVLALLFCVLIMQKKSWKVDWIIFFLFLRLGFAVITMLLMPSTVYESMKAIFVLLTGILIYYLIFNSKDINKSEFLNLISLFLLILSIQTIGSYIINYINYSTLSKSLIQIPIGRSNYIATLILVCTVYLFFEKNKNFFQKTVFALGIVTLLLTFSFGALISLVVIILISLLIGQRASIVKRIIIFSSFSAILFYVFFVYFPNYNSVENNIISIVSRNISIKITYFLDGNYERLFSDRFILYSQSWENFISSPLFGTFSGLEFRGRSIYKPHNLFLEALSSYGFLGFVCLLIPLVILFIRMVMFIKQNSSNTMRACIFSLLAGIIHGLVEPNFFSFEFEFLWWGIAGFAISQMKQTKLLVNKRRL